MKKVLLTGVSSGIGQALARSYLDDGFKVYGVSRREPPCLVDHPNFLFRSIDLKRSDQVTAQITAFLKEEHETSLDQVVLNAGTAGKVAVSRELAVTEFAEVMAINVWANKAILDSLFSRELPIQVRQVVAISSHAGIAAFRGSGPYCVSKAALNMLISVYATEQDQTHFSAIAPPLVDTAMQTYFTTITDDRFATVRLLRAAKQQGLMLSPDTAAHFLRTRFDAALNTTSGSYVDAAVFNQIPAQNRVVPQVVAPGA